MKKLLLALMGTAALAFPAMAQTQGQQAQPEQSQQQASQHRSLGEPRISPDRLSRQQVERLQQALNQKGFDAGHVDGIWGSKTRAALKNFRQRQGMKQTNGGLDQQTLSALGLNPSQFTQGGQAGETTGAAHAQPQPAPKSNAPQNNQQNK